jgi:pimeloyl-ACP methyl ester carboxylesterase
MNAATSPLPPVVFIHGWKASVLADEKTGKTEFDYTLGRLLGIAKDPALELPLQWDENHNQVRDNLVAVNPCHSATAFCGVKIGSIYGPMLDFLEKARDLRTFAYDWRRPLDESAVLFEEFLVQVKEQCGQPPQVVAHSMGCLITLSVLNKRPQIYHSILFAAAAFSPVVSILKDFSLVGGMNVVVRNSTMFTPKVHLSNTAPFYFLPYPMERERWGKPHVITFWDESKTTLDQYDLHKVDTWKRLKIGMYHPESGVEYTPAHDAWLQTVLNRVRTYREGLIPTNSGLKSSDCPPVCVLRSDYADTEFGYMCSNGQIDLKNNITFLRGDGRVTLEDSMPPTGIPVSKVVTNDREHSQVLNDIESVSLLLDHLIAEKKKTDRK